MTILRLLAVALFFLPSFAFAQTYQERAEAISIEKERLSNLSLEAFREDMATLLFSWGEDPYGTVHGDFFFDTSKMLVEVIQSFEGQDDIYNDDSVIDAVHLIARFETDPYDDEEALLNDAMIVYGQGVIVDGLSLRQEFSELMREIWMRDNNRGDIDGLIGEEAPHEFIQLLFGKNDVPTLCHPGEAVIWSCSEQDRERLISVCASAVPDGVEAWVQYRIGRQDDLELVVPENRSGSAERFSFFHERFGTRLEFENGQYLYRIDQDKFTSDSFLMVTRQDEEVYSASCKTSHPFLETVQGHLGYESDPELLHVIPKPMVEETPTACSSDQKVLFSCQDEEGAIDSICVTKAGDESQVFFSKAYANGDRDDMGSRAYDDDSVSYYRNGKALIVHLDQGNEEFNYLGDPSDGSAGFTYWRGGTPRLVNDCTLSHLDEELFFDLEFGEFQNERRTYAPVEMTVESEVVEMPDTLKTRVSTLKSLEAEGALIATAGNQPREDLGGLTAKEYVMSAHSSDFRCEADHGGMCAGSDLPELMDETSFILAFSARGEAFADFQKSSFDLKSADEIDVDALAFSFQDLDPDEYVFEYGSDAEPMYCTARADYDWDAYVASITVFQESFAFTANEEYEWLWDSMRAVMSRYNVRAQPSTSASIVGKLENEMAHFPNVNEVISADGHNWRQVMLPSGRKGYIAVKPKDFLKIGKGDAYCGVIENDKALISSFSFGGD